MYTPLTAVLVMYSRDMYTGRHVHTYGRREEGIYTRWCIPPYIPWWDTLLVSLVVYLLPSLLGGRNREN